uniref:Uncharacterized protein n=1 Tax=Anguilla anguilla TaxID=7936 RepID=A0A0E9TJQ9_ANGAN
MERIIGCGNQGMKITMELAFCLTCKLVTIRTFKMV